MSEPVLGPNRLEFLSAYFARLADILKFGPGLGADLLRIHDMWLAARAAGGRTLFVGNGGSAAIASHMAVDLSKNAGIPALAFNDPALITCLCNDYGHENWMAHAVRLAARPGDVLVAISSSGSSKNVLNAAAQARSLGMPVVTLSAFEPNNPLRRVGDVNLWLDCRAYNIVETVHQAWLAAVIDMVIGKAEYPATP